MLSSSGTDTYGYLGGHRRAERSQHGGANLKVMHQLDYILENVEDPTHDEVRELQARSSAKSADAAA